MDWLDILILVPLILAAYWGLQQGLLATMGHLMAVIFAFLGAYYALPYLVELVDPYLPFAWHNKRHFITFIVSFATFFLVSYFGMLYLTQKGLVAIQMQGLDKLMGGMMGFLRAAIWIGLILFLIDNLDTKNWLISRDQKQRSQLYKTFLQADNVVLSQARNHISLQLLKKEWIDEVKL